MSRAVRIPRSIDVPAKKYGYVLQERARVVICSVTPHLELSPLLWPRVQHALALAPESVRLLQDTGGGAWSDPVSLAQIERYAHRVARGRSNGSFDVMCEDPADAFAIEYRALHPVHLDGGWTSTFAVWFSRERLYRDPDGIVRWLRDALALAPWSSACVGLAIDGNRTRTYPAALKHLALDLSSPSSVSHDLGDQIFGVAWLTGLSTKQLAQLGGAARLRRALGKAAELALIPDGALLRLGARPVRGTTPVELRPYEAVMKAVEPALHVPRKVGYFTCGFDDGSGKYDGRADAMQAGWHRRFLVGRTALAKLFRP